MAARVNVHGQSYEPSAGCNGRPTRRHRDSSAHMKAVSDWQARHGREARQERAKTINAERAARSWDEQIKLLDKRLGIGVGAVKERKRLAKYAEERALAMAEAQKKAAETVAKSNIKSPTKKPTK